MDTQATIKAWLSKGDNTCDCRSLAHRQCLIRMLAAMWDRQTRDEQLSHSTRKRNNVGFNANDARIAGWLIENIRNNDLDVKLAWKAKFMLKKYSRQLAEIKESQHAN